MPSIRHEAAVGVLRDQPAILVSLLREQLRLPARPRVELEDPNEKLVATEVRADLLVLLKAERRRLRLIVEVQLRKDSRKRRVWPVYLWEQWRRFGGEVYLVVIALDEAVARWAAVPIDSGQPRSAFHPVVLGPESLPRITDPEEAARAPELALLAALSHRDDADVAVAAVDGAFRSLEPDRAAEYTLFLQDVLSNHARSLLEAWMKARKSTVWDRIKDPWVLGWIDKGRKEGREEGREEGRQEGEARATAEALLRVLAARELKVSLAQRRRIERCDDVARLQSWLVRAATATSTRSVFTAPRP